MTPVGVIVVEECRRLGVGVIGGETVAMSAGPCGSQRHQSHDGGSSTTATRRQSAGPVHVASWMMIERTTEAAVGPATASAASAPSSTGTGASANCSAAATTDGELGSGRRPDFAWRAVEGDLPCHRSPAEHHPEGVDVVATTLPDVGPRGRRGDDGLGDGRCGCEVVLPAGETLGRHGAREGGHLAPMDGAGPAPVSYRADATGHPHADGGEQPDGTEEQEQR